MPSERLQVILELTAGQYKREAREAASATGQIGAAAQGVTGRVGGLSTTIGKLGAVMGGVFATRAVADFARDSIMAASDLEESMNAVQVVFGEASDAIFEFGKTSVDSVGLAAVNVNKSATVIGAFLRNVGLDAEEAADKTLELTTRAADMASVFNTSVPDALEAIQSALRGQSNPIERFGVSLTAAAVDAEAAALGYEKVAGEFDATAKNAARLSLIMQQTDKLAGDFQNTADSTANTMKRLNERFLETKARVGVALLPAFTALLDLAEDLAPAFEDFAVEIAGLVSEIKPLLSLLGELVGIYSDLKGWTDEAAGSQNDFERQLGKVVDLLTSGGLGILGKIFDEFTPAAKEAAEKGEKVGDAMQFMADATKDDLIPAVSKAVGPVNDLRTAQQRAADATKAHRDALIALTDRLLAQLNPALAAYQALQDLEEAQTAAAEAAREHGADSKEAAEAQLELAIATAAAQAALNNFGDTEGAIRALANTLGITADEAARILVNLGLITEREWRTTVVIGVRTEGDLSALERGVIPEGTGIRTTTTSGTRRASGGPVTAGQPYLVGERGPELFVSGSSGSIINNDVLRAMSRPNGPTIVMQGPTQNFQQDLQYATILASIQTLVEG